MRLHQCPLYSIMRSSNTQCNEQWGLQCMITLSLTVWEIEHEPRDLVTLRCVLLIINTYMSHQNMVKTLHKLLFIVCCKLHCLGVVLAIKLIYIRSYEKKNKKEKQERETFLFVQDKLPVRHPLPCDSYLLAWLISKSSKKVTFHPHDSFSYNCNWTGWTSGQSYL